MVVEEEEVQAVEASCDSKPVLICSPIRLSGSVKKKENLLIHLSR